MGAIQSKFLDTVAKPAVSSSKFNRVGNITGADTSFTASNSVPGAFIVNSAGDSVITAIGGGTLTASNLTAGSLYEIGLSRVSGSGNVDVIYIT